MDSMNGLKGTYGERLWLAHLDVNDTPALKRVVNKKAFADCGKIDVIVNNAGYGSSAPSSR
jgi:NADP-dependent 3-hydroxy acid dehydrogenase YdfG